MDPQARKTKCRLNTLLTPNPSCECQGRGRPPTSASSRRQPANPCNKVDQSIKFFDRQPSTTDNNSLYFTDQDHAGGRVFAFWKQEVRQFLIDNGKSLLEEYHVDGLRYDQVTVIAESGGWYFAQDLTNTLRFVKPSAVQIAEYWGNERWKGIAAPPHGMGFDIGYSDALRDALREVKS